MKWWKLRPHSRMRPVYVPDTDEGEAEEAYDLGPCCACGQSGPTARNMILLDLRAAHPGSGWGCVTCGLPCDGALAVVCDECSEAERPIRWACLRYVTEPGRIPIKELCEPFVHEWRCEDD